MRIKFLFFLLTALLLTGSVLLSEEPVASEAQGSFIFSESPTNQVLESPATPSPMLLSPEDFAPATAPIFTDFDPLAGSLRVITSLFIIIALAFALSWFLQKKVGFGANVFGKVLGILPLDNKRFIYLVDIMGRVFILGVTEHNINLLGELTDKESLDSLRLENSVPNMRGMDSLFPFLRKKTEQPPPDSEPEHNVFNEEEVSSQNLRTRERLKKINDLMVKRSDRNNSPE